MGWRRHTRPLVSLASKYGFTKAISCPANAVRRVRQRRSQPHSHRLLPANGKVATAGVATAAGAMVGSVVIEESAVNGESVVRVRKETDHRVENVAPANLGIDPHVHKANRETGHHAHKESAVNGESVVRVRKETDHRASRESAVSDLHGSHDPRASDHHERRANGVSDHHASRASEPVGPSRLLRFSLRLMRHPHRRHRQHRRHQRLARPRANRGDSKPCYWHHHVQSTADNIAVA